MNKYVKYIQCLVVVYGLNSLFYHVMAWPFMKLLKPSQILLLQFLEQLPKVLGCGPLASSQPVRILTPDLIT